MKSLKLKIRLKLSIGLVIPMLFNACGDAPFSAKTDAQLESQNQTEATNSPTPADDNPLIPVPPVASDPQDPSTGGPAFLATGFFHSTMYTCDGGKTWKGYQSASEEVRCGNGVDCTHSQYSPKGITYGDKGFVATFGWGEPGAVVRTFDGSNFDVVFPESSWAGVAYGQGKYVLHSRSVAVSDDLNTWLRSDKFTYAPGVKNTRVIKYVPIGSGFFVSMGNSGGVGDLLISRDGGVTFSRPNIPEACADTGNFAYNNNIVLLKTSAALCYSLDAGATWLINSSIGQNTNGNLLFNGNEFRMYQGTSFYSSTDGLTWKDAQNVTPVGFNRFGDGFKMVTYHPTQGTYIAFSSAQYEKSKFYYSTDGIAWMQVATESAPSMPHKFKFVEPGFLQSCQ